MTMVTMGRTTVTMVTMGTVVGRLPSAIAAVPACVYRQVHVCADVNVCIQPKHWSSLIVCVDLCVFPAHTFSPDLIWPQRLSLP